MSLKWNKEGVLVYTNEQAPKVIRTYPENGRVFEMLEDEDKLKIIMSVEFDQPMNTDYFSWCEPVGQNLFIDGFENRKGLTRWVSDKMCVHVATLRPDKEYTVVFNFTSTVDPDQLKEKGVIAEGFFGFMSASGNVVAEQHQITFRTERIK